MYEFDESRLEKIATMREEGQEPYPHNLSVTNTAAEAIAMMGDRDGEELGQDATEVADRGAGGGAC